MSEVKVVRTSDVDTVVEIVVVVEVSVSVVYNRLAFGKSGNGKEGWLTVSVEKYEVVVVSVIYEISVM